MSLFEKRDFIGHSGKELDFKIECDYLTEEDVETLSYLISKKYTFKKVIGVPTGAIRFEMALRKYEDEESENVLIVDDVLTTGGSMNEMRLKIFDKYYGDNVIGVVIFARSEPEEWIKPIFRMW